MMQKILFITWDGPQTTYMEGLFIPIFNEIQKKSNYKFHIIQFTWASQEKINVTEACAISNGITYLARPVHRKPLVSVGSIFTVAEGIQFIKKYLVTNSIDIVMPRSTMPSLMINRLKNANFKVLFDADGLPLEERVDFAGLSRSSIYYKFLKKEENKILKYSDGVITRSKKAIAVHLETLNSITSDKFSVVLNGRNTDFFKPDPTIRAHIRKILQVESEATLLVYCGSLGKQYGWKEMIKIFKKVTKRASNSKFLILTGDLNYAKERIPPAFANAITVLTVPFQEVPNYLSAADIAFAIREPKFSMRGVAPIKLGEYLLMGLPVIASKGIGDTEEILSTVPNTFLFDQNDYNKIENALSFIENIKISSQDAIRGYGLDYFSLEKSAESYITAIKKLK